MPRAVCASAMACCGRAGEPRDHRHRPLGPGRRGFRRELQHRPIQPDLADRELRGVDADGQPAGAGIEVIARQRPLMPGVELAVGVERQRMRGDYRAVRDQLANFGFDLAMMHDALPIQIPGRRRRTAIAQVEPVAGPKRMR